MKLFKGTLIYTAGWFALWLILISCSLGGIFAQPTATPTSTPTPTITPTPTTTPTPTLTPTPTASPTPTPQTVLLRLKIQEGERYRIRMVIDQTITQFVSGKAEEMLQTLGFGYTYTITEVDVDGNGWIDVLYDWVKFEQVTSAGSSMYDSANPPEIVPPELLGYKALLGTGFSLKISPRGEIMEIQGLEEMYAAMIDALEIADPVQRAEMEQFLNDQFGIDTMKEQMRSTTFEYPENAVQVGETWTSSNETMVLVPMLITNTYTLRDLDGNIATIDASSTVTTNMEAEPTDFGDFQVRYDVSGDQKGTILIDTEIGWTLDSTVTQELSGDMILFFEEDQLSVPISLESETHFEMLKLE